MDVADQAVVTMPRVLLTYLATLGRESKAFHLVLCAIEHQHFSKIPQVRTKGPLLMKETKESLFAASITYEYIL